MFRGDVHRRGLLKEGQVCPRGTLGEVQGGGAFAHQRAFVRRDFWTRGFSLTTLHPL